MNRIIFSWRAAKEWCESCSAGVPVRTDDHKACTWEPAKPVGVTWRARIKAAICVLRGEGFVVRWY